MRLSRRSLTAARRAEIACYSLMPPGYYSACAKWQRKIAGARWRYELGMQSQRRRP